MTNKKALRMNGAPGHYTNSDEVPQRQECIGIRTVAVKDSARVAQSIYWIELFQFSDCTGALFGTRFDDQTFVGV
jgi:hypothetical protein